MAYLPTPWRYTSEDSGGWTDPRTGMNLLTLLQSGGGGGIPRTSPETLQQFADQALMFRMYPTNPVPAGLGYWDPQYQSTVASLYDLVRTGTASPTEQQLWQEYQREAGQNVSAMQGLRPFGDNAGDGPSLWGSFLQSLPFLVAGGVMGAGAAGALGAETAAAGTVGAEAAATAPSLLNNPSLYWSALQGIQGIAGNPSGQNIGGALGSAAGSALGAYYGVPGGSTVGGFLGREAGSTFGSNGTGGTMADASGITTTTGASGDQSGGINWLALLPLLAGLGGSGLSLAGGVQAGDRANTLYGQNQTLYQLLTQLAQQYQQGVQGYNQQNQGAYGTQLGLFAQMLPLIQQQQQQQQTGYQQNVSSWEQLIPLLQQYQQQQQQGYGTNVGLFNEMLPLIRQYQQQQQGAYGQQQADYAHQRDAALNYQAQQQNAYGNDQQTYQQIMQEVGTDWLNKGTTLAARNAIAGRLADPRQVASGTQAMLNPFLQSVGDQTTQTMERQLAGQGITDGGAFQRAIAQALTSQDAQFWQQAMQNFTGSQQAALSGYSYAPTGPYMPYGPQPPVPGGLPGVPEPPSPAGFPSYPTAIQPPGFPDYPGAPAPAPFPGVPRPPQPLAAGGQYPNPNAYNYIPGTNQGPQPQTAASLQSLQGQLQNLFRLLGINPNMLTQGGNTTQASDAAGAPLSTLATGDYGGLGQGYDQGNIPYDYGLTLADASGGGY